MADEQKRLRFAVMGAGISGMAAAYNIKREYPDAELVLFEKHIQLGGTWAVNTYPGAACDIMSHFYSLSFALNPTWTQCYSPQSEIQEYLVRTAEATGIAPHIRFQHRIESGVWDKQTKEWNVAVRNLADGSTSVFRADFLFVAPGALCAENTIDVPGAAEFLSQPGKSIFHSASWRHDTPVEGTRVAVIGTGASAAQIVPGIVDKVSKLTLLQRTPAWVVPRGNFKYPSWLQKLFFWFPVLMSVYRLVQWITHDLRFYAFIKPKLGLNNVAMKMARKHLEKSVPDLKLREALTPHYPMGCKRVVCSDDFYPALCKPQCTLVPSPLVKFTKTGIVAADGTAVDCDVVILATGFDVAKSFPGVPFTGLAGKSLAQQWATHGGPEAYLGILCPNMPNMFMLVGPNTGLGHSSIIAMIECQVHYAMACVHRAVKAGNKNGNGRPAVLTVKQAAHDEYNQWLQSELRGRVWTGCHSWYNMQGQKNATMWPETVTAYWLATRRPNWAHIDVQ